MIDFAPTQTTKFQLDPAFVAGYRTRTPPFGFNGLGELVYYRTYSRLKPDGTNEVWYETVQRVVEGTYSMQKRWALAMHLPWSERKAQRSAQEMYERMFTMKFLPPGRGLWAMGSPLTEDRGLYAALNNCGFTSTDTIAEDLAEPFCFLMDASMLGIGVGFDVKGAGKVVVRRPGLRPTPAEELAEIPAEYHWGIQTVQVSDTYVIPDTREGWVESVRRLITSYLVPEDRSEQQRFDYSQIRPAGSPIKGFGGVASGAGPLIQLHDDIRRVLDQNIGAPITKTTIVDLMNLIGRCVVAGNVRRTAEIVFGDMSPEYLDLKNYEVNPEREAWGWTSNNSVFAELGDDYTRAAARVAINGEPGFAWLHNMQAYGRMIDPPNWADARVAGGNPCLEQSLESYELCCLVETFPANHDSLQDYQRTLKYAYLYAKTVTLGMTPWRRTNAVMLRNRRIGLSQSGIVQAIEKLGMNAYRLWCEAGYETVRHYDTVYSEWLAVPRSVKVTSVKPSGSVSLLAGATPGMHYPEDRVYIRRMRLAKQSDLVPALRAAGYPLEECFGDAHSLVVEVPVEIADVRRTAREVSMWEQLALAAFLQRHWADNQVSCTVTFDPDTEGPQIAHALDLYQFQLKGVSFLPRKPAGAYRQMPYEAITVEEYYDRLRALRPLAFQNTHEAAEFERFCDGATCTI